jgi:thioredoxin-like negative regulator of GroEL
VEQSWREQSLLEAVAQQLAQQLLLERIPERASEKLLGIVQPSKRGRRKVEQKQLRELRPHGGLLA